MEFMFKISFCKSFFAKSFEENLGICSVIMTEAKLYKNKQTNNIDIYMYTHLPLYLCSFWLLYFLWMVPWPLGEYCTQPLSAKVMTA